MPFKNSLLPVSSPNSINLVLAFEFVGEILQFHHLDDMY